jgi:predicted nuclease of restriction endonuclease-like (RecB) superfamily
MNKKVLSNLEYIEFVKEIKQKIYNSQYEAMKSVNKELIDLYWYLGKMIVKKQDQFSWGKSIVENLSYDLQKEFIGIKGFSAQNLWLMRQFYNTYSTNEKLQPLVREISWTKNIIIISKCKDDLHKEFYILMTKKFGWTKDVLTNQIENKSYEKYLLNQTNFNKTLPDKYKNQSILAVKDEYNFDFLELAEKHSERELEKAIMDNIRNFLIEMGGYFSYVGNQYRILIEEKEYFIDLLLYHRKLKSFVAIELKIGEFKPEYAGKMQFYLAALDNNVKLENENNSIGIIICKSKQKTIVEFALQYVNTPIGVSTYKITDKLPKKYENLLPSKEEISKNIENLFKGIYEK